LLITWASCKGPIAHDPASNAPTTKKESSAETPNTDLIPSIHRENSSSPAGHDAKVVAQKGKTPPEQHRIVAQIRGTSPSEVSCISYTPESEFNIENQQGSTSLGQPRFVTTISPSDISCIPFTPESESNIENQGGSTPSGRPHVVAAKDGTFPDDISCITPEGGSNTGNQVGRTSSGRPHVVSGSTLNEADALAQRYCIPADEFNSIARSLLLDIERTNEARSGESLDSAETRRLNTTENQRIEALPLDVLGEEIQQYVKKANQAIESGSYDQ
jgi:hypothetical protein